jgi:tetratricopeptide (TPR) repeat protein
LEDAISSHHKALTLHPLGHSYCSSSLYNLINVLFAHFRKLGRVEDLENAISSHCQALFLCPLGHPNHSNFLNDLANVLSIRFIQSGRMGDLDESFTLYEQAANDLTSSWHHHLAAAIEWATKARQYQHKSITCAYSTSLRILERCLISYPSVESQQKFLATAHIPRSLASEAASTAIAADDLEAAVELLEQGRAILWSKMEGYRYPLVQLRHHMFHASGDL